MANCKTMRNFSIVLAVSLLFAASSLAFGRNDKGEAVTILFTGDILLDRGVRQVIEHQGFRALFADDSLRSLLKGSLPAGEGRGRAYFVVGNLECPATTIQAPAFKRFVFRGEPQWLDSLCAYGFTHLNLANNHSVDQGRQGLRDTRLNILKARLVPIGADSTMQAAAQAHLLCASPRRVWLLASNRLPLESFSYLPDRESVSQEPFDSLLNRVKTLKMVDSTAIVVVNLHWGEEHTLRPMPQQRIEARALVDAGADMVVGHHTHTLQTTETYNEKTIFYGIGNFIFDQHKPLNTRACVVRLRIQRDGKVSTDAIPIRIDRCAPKLHVQ